MVKIEIDIPRPWHALAVIAAVVWVAIGGTILGLPPSLRAEVTGEKVEARSEESAEEDHVHEDAVMEAGEESDAAGGVETEQQIADLEATIHDQRVQREVLSRKEEILRYELSLLEEDGAEAVTDDLVVRRAELVALLRDGKEAERQLLDSLRQMWDARGFALRLSTRQPGEDETVEMLAWPVEPQLGLSAHFTDPGYRKRFGFDHHAIDIPVAQGSDVYAPATGVVAKVSDNGYGYNSLVIRHAGGMSTLYGHVSEFLVKEGDVVRPGQRIAKSGGDPGKKGSGRITTGPHLHFEVLIDGQKVDPLPHLEQDDRAA